MFMEVLPLRMVMEAGDTFLTLIRRVTVEVLDSLKHGQYTNGNPIHNTSYQVTLNYINASLPGFHGSKVSAEWVHAGYQNEILDLHVRQFNSDGDLVLEFDFDSDLFTEEQQEEAARHFLQILDAGSDDINCSISSTLLLTESQKQRLLALTREAGFEFD
jgi:hypothetical protein